MAVQEDGVVRVAVMDGLHAVPAGVIAIGVAGPVPDVVVEAVVVDMGDDLRRSLVVGLVDALLVGTGGAVRSAIADADHRAIAETAGSRVAASAASEDLDVANVRIDEAEGGPLAFADGGLQIRVQVRVGRVHQIVVIVVRLHAGGRADLLQAGRAGDLAGLFTGLRQRGQQHGGQNRDDRDDDQQFDQGEAQELLHVCFSPFFVIYWDRKINFELNYTGEWKSGSPDGIGIYETQNRIYEGNWRGGMFMQLMDAANKSDDAKEENVNLNFMIPQEDIFINDHLSTSSNSNNSKSCLLSVSVEVIK